MLETLLIDQLYMRIVTSRITLVTRYVLYHFLVLPLLPVVLLFYFSLFWNRFVSISNKPLLTEFRTRRDKILQFDWSVT